MTSKAKIGSCESCLARTFAGSVPEGLGNRLREFPVDGVAFLAILGRIFLFEVGRVGNYSMVPNLIPGDIFLMRKVGLLGTGDIAVCPNPENPGELVVGRIIGVPGDTLRIKKNRLNINERQIHYQFIEPIIYFDNTTA